MVSSANQDPLSVLPDTPIPRDGLVSPLCRAYDLANFRQAVRHVHRLPYGRPSDRGDYRLILDEQVGSCSTKHAFLAALAEELDLAVTLQLIVFPMGPENTPGVGPVLDDAGLPFVPEAHCYLQRDGHDFDVTHPDEPPTLRIENRLHEETIDPREIVDHKVKLHRRYVREWAENSPHADDLTFRDVWRIREACIRALASDTDRDPS